MTDKAKAVTRLITIAALQSTSPSGHMACTATLTIRVTTKTTTAKRNRRGIRETLATKNFPRQAGASVAVENMTWNGWQ